MSKYDVDAIRQKLKQSQAGKFTDPDQFKPAKGTSATEAIKYRFYVLGPLMKGDILKSGEVEKTMDQFFLTHANHWVNDKPHPCPRVWDGDDKCKICDFGFDLLRLDENKEEAKRSAIVKQWMPTTYYAVNIFFPNWNKNPEELRNKVKWYNAPKTCFDHWTAALMKEDAGDEDDPEAHGVFFDENSAFLYELQVLKQGRQNSYKTSKFLPNGGKSQPMVRNKDGSPHEKGLASVLRLRHNLFTKIETPDIGKIDKIYAVMIDGDDGDDGGGFDQDETNSAKAKPKEEPKAKLKEAKPAEDDRDIVDSVTESESPTSEPSGEGSSNLADEVPLGDSTDDSVPDGDDDSKTPEPAAVTAGGGDDVESDEIDDLLSQLDDDD